MRTVRQILEKKGRDIFSISPEASVYKALEVLAEKNIGGLLVIDDEGKLHGIITERDYSRKVILQQRSSKDVKVKDIMTEKLLYVNIDQHVEDCMALMSGKKIRHLPVLENDKLAGIISIGDVVNAFIDEREFVIDQLVQYITDGSAIGTATVHSFNKTME